MAKTLEPFDVEKKVREGWIHTRMMIEVLAIAKDTAESALRKHADGLDKEKRTLVIRKEFKDTRLVKNPHPNIEVGFSQIVEVELLTADFDSLVYIIMNYAPSSIEILAPAKISIDIGEAQGILTSIAALIHKFAALGIGGVVVKS